MEWHIKSLRIGDLEIPVENKKIKEYGCWTDEGGRPRIIMSTMIIVITKMNFRTHVSKRKTHG